jgi:hypothetical protein
MEGRESKSVLDADTDVDVLRQRVNAYMATPEMVNYNRRVKQEITEGKMRSETYIGSGGGCWYEAWLSIVEVKPLKGGA